MKTKWDWLTTGGKPVPKKALRGIPTDHLLDLYELAIRKRDLHTVPIPRYITESVNRIRHEFEMRSNR